MLENNNNLNNVGIFTLFKEFIEFYNFEENRCISLKEKYDKNNYKKHNDDYYFNIEDPIDIKHNPGDRSLKIKKELKEKFENATMVINKNEFK